MIQTIYDLAIAPFTKLWHAQPEFEPWPALESGRLWQFAELTKELHYDNCSVWHYEDYARGLDPATVVWAKKFIDLHNQSRNNFIERLDSYLIELQTARPVANPVYASETLGSILDRVSILDLKIYHTKELVEQHNRKHLAERIEVLGRQCAYLIHCGEELYTGICDGTRRMQLFKQLKMYNCSDTNLRFGK